MKSLSQGHKARECWSWLWVSVCLTPKPDPVLLTTVAGPLPCHPGLSLAIALFSCRSPVLLSDQGYF